MHKDLGSPWGGGNPDISAGFMCWVLFDWPSDSFGKSANLRGLENYRSASAAKVLGDQSRAVDCKRVRNADSERGISGFKHEADVDRLMT